MNHILFAELLKEKRAGYGISQDRLSVISGISCHYISDVETGKTMPSTQKQEALIDALEKLNPDKPLTMLIDYVRIRFSGRSIKEVVEDIMRIKLIYMYQQDFGLYSYDAQYIHGDIIVLVSEDEQKGILLELKGKGCRQFEMYLNAQHRNWYDFFRDAKNSGGVMKRLDLAVNDHTGILDIPELVRKCKLEECISVCRSFKSYLSGELIRSVSQEQHKDDMGTTLYIGSMQSEIYFCLYEKDYEQYHKYGIAIEESPIKNRLEIRLKNERADHAVKDLLAYQDAERTAFAIINRYLRFVDREDGKPREQWKMNRKWAYFMGDNREQLKLTTKPEPYTFNRTLNWLAHQVAPTLRTALEIDARKGTHHIEEMIAHARLSEKQEKLLEQVTLPIDEIIIRGGDAD